MPPRRRLSDADRGRALGWLQEGVTLREVGNRLGVTHSVIQRLRDRFNNTGSVQEPRRSGRPRLTTRRQDHFVVLSSLRSRTATANTLRGQLRAASNITVSDQTIRNRLHEANLRSRRPAVRPPLTQLTAQPVWRGLDVIWPGQGSSGPGCSLQMSPASACPSMTVEFVSGGVQGSASMMRWCVSTITSAVDP